VSSQSLEPRQAGWYPDPAGGHGLCWHDGQGWTGKISYAKPRKPLGAPFAALADRLTRMLIVAGVVEVAALGLAAYAYASPETVVRANLTAQANLPTYHLVSYVLGGLEVLVYLAAGLSWLVWQRRLALSAPGQLRSSPAMHVVWWFVPFANLVMPVRSRADLWRSYGTARAGARVNGPPFVSWWLFFLVSQFFGGLLLSPGIAGTSVADVHLVAVVQMVGAAVTALAAGLAVLVVRIMSWQALLAHAG
jgi:hypothetical protein